MERLTIDFETRSEVDLRKSNAWVYSEHPSTDVICLAWRAREGGTRAWANPEIWGGDGRDLFWEGTTYGASHIPAPLAYYINDTDCPIYAFNAAFEIAMWENIMVARHGWPAIARERWRDSRAVANYLALPPALGKLCEVLKLQGKDPAGDRLISKYSKLHLKTAQYHIPDEDLRAFIKYCKQDVNQEVLADSAIGELPDQEQGYCLEDLTVNLRGLRLDIPAITKARDIAVKRQAQLANEFEDITGFRPTQHAKLKEWLDGHGHPVADTRAETIEVLLESTLPYHVAEALELRQAYNKASTKKLAAMLRNASADGRARLQTQYHGANTGRNTGAGFQPLNLPRTYEDFEPEQVVRDIGYGDPEYLDAVYGDAMDAVSKSLRHYIIPTEGHRFVVADFVSIEAVILAVLSNETKKIQAFRNKEPIYERTADIVFGLPPGTVTKATHPEERRAGKVAELASGYQGSVGAWRKFDNSDRFTDDEVKAIVKAWRGANPNIVTFWRDLEQAAFRAMDGLERVEVGDIVFGMHGDALYMEAPNGKRIWYQQPELVVELPHWATEDDDAEPVVKLRYMSWKDGRWQKTYTYGGKLAENACQCSCLGRYSGPPRACWSSTATTWC